MEHNAGKRVHPVGKRAGKMRLIGTHCPTPGNNHAMRQKMRAGVFLPKRSEQIELCDVFQRKLGKIQAGVHFNAGNEIFGRKLVHVGAQAFRKLGELRSGQRNAHSSVVPAETRKDVLTRGNCLEQVNVTNATARTMGFVPFDGE